MWTSIERLAVLQPRFVSVTYGADGSTRERTHTAVARVNDETELVVAPHLTCVGATRDEINEIATAISSAVEEQGAATEEIARNVEQASEGTSEVTKNITEISAGVDQTSIAQQFPLYADDVDFFNSLIQSYSIFGNNNINL